MEPKRKNSSIIFILIAVVIIITTGAIVYLTHDTKEDLPVEPDLMDLAHIKLIRERYQQDSLKKYKRIKQSVSQRGYSMHFYTPETWVPEEPPIDFSYARSYNTSRHKNPEGVIHGSSIIVCIASLTDSTGKMDSVQAHLLKTLSGIEAEDPEYGPCNIEELLAKRLRQIRKQNKDATINSIKTVNRMYVPNEQSVHLVTGRHIRYSFNDTIGKFEVLEVLTYIDEVGFLVYLGAPEKDFQVLESVFTDISNNLYFGSFE